MENIRFVKNNILKSSVILGLLLLAPSISFAYETSVHQKLTYKTLKSYQDIFDIKIEQKYITEIIKGSTNEDSGGRPIYHFFDPVNNKGLTVVKSLESSKDWSQDTTSQSNYISSLNYARKYFESPDDFSWDRAIYDYVYGDKDRAMVALGHVLHLVQDMSVPPHVRNDQHLSYVDDSPYEIFIKDLIKLSSNV